MQKMASHYKNTDVTKSSSSSSPPPLSSSSSSSSSSLMALQPKADFRFLLPVSSVFDLSFQFVILHLLISVCTQFNGLFFFYRPLSRLPCGLSLNTSRTFLLLSILLTQPIQSNRLILTN